VVDLGRERQLVHDSQRDDVDRGVQQRDLLEVCVVAGVDAPVAADGSGAGGLSARGACALGSCNGTGGGGDRRIGVRERRRERQRRGRGWRRRLKLKPSGLSVQPYSLDEYQSHEKEVA